MLKQQYQEILCFPKWNSLNEVIEYFKDSFKEMLKQQYQEILCFPKEIFESGYRIF
jgi:hypothetical protein